jgi:hypothetical protein
LNIITPYFRSSSLGNHEFCQMQYFLQYVLGYQSPANKKAQLGTITHKALEVLANCKKCLQDNPEKRKFSYIDPEIGEVNFTKSELYTDKFVEDISFTSFLYYSKKCIHNYIEKDFDFSYSLVKVALNEYNRVFDPRYRNIIDPEPFFDIPIEADWAKMEINGKEVQLCIKGTIDLVTELDSDTIEVCDWKTGQRKDWATGEVKDYKKLMKDTQLLLYNYAISRLYPQYKNRIMTIIFLRDGGPFSLCFDESDEQEFLHRLKKKFFEISNTKIPKLCSPQRTSFKCTKLCHFYKEKYPGSEKSICEHVHDGIKTYGIKLSQEKFKAQGFDQSNYNAPGKGN